MTGYIITKTKMDTKFLKKQTGYIITKISKNGYIITKIKWIQNS